MILQDAKLELVALSRQNWAILVHNTKSCWQVPQRQRQLQLVQLSLHEAAQEGAGEGEELRLHRLQRQQRLGRHHDDQQLRRRKLFQQIVKGEIESH